MQVSLRDAGRGQGPQGRPQPGPAAGDHGAEEGEQLVLQRRRRQQSAAGAARAVPVACWPTRSTASAEGFTKELEIHGVGYRAELAGSAVVLNLGYTHPIDFPIPEGIEVKSNATC